jgi:tripartite-type tricarboxylate transporter receptor subunit TctC
MKNGLLGTALLCAMGVLGGRAVAAEYPARPVLLVIPFAPAGSTTLVFRAMSERLTENLGQQLVILSKPGGAATIGMNQVAKATPDGYTLGVATLSFAANPPFLGKEMPFDTAKDFVAVSMVSRLPMVAAVNPKVPVRSIKDLIALAKAHPGEINYGSAGIASSGHLGGALFELMAGVRMTHIPYATTNSMEGLVGGQHQLQISPVPSLLQFIKNKQIIAIGVTTLKPDPSLPGVPPIADTVRGYEAYEWSGIVAPRGTPQPVINKMQQAIVKTLQDAEVRQRIENMGAQVVGSTQPEFAAFIKNELVKWDKVFAALRANGSLK